MNISQFYANNLACPIDGNKLICCGDEKVTHLRCNQGHCFDVSRQGYINLLNVKDKRSKDPGDGSAMIAARSRILSSGLYEKISSKLSQTIDELMQVLLSEHQLENSVLTVLDAGCGEGYYLDACITALQPHYNLQAIGVDISKWAVSAAAKRNKQITWLVASNRKLPVLEKSIDVIVCGFGFPVFSAFKQALKSGAFIVMIDPAEQHLLELRKIIYPMIKDYKENDFSVAKKEGFSIVSQSPLTYSVNVHKDEMQDILTMSPHLYKATMEGKKAVAAIDELAMTVDITFTVLQLNNS
jgi:23S rRNA (guanine745-N1)-methyltransferase